ncbi:Uncharacterised protein [Mycobacteroides abscessus subsp. abscessus]|nr:Uncharacterised protein [Mycobacteroides abscessus subsp. abscessus]
MSTKGSVILERRTVSARSSANSAHDVVADVSRSRQSRCRCDDTATASLGERNTPRMSGTGEQRSTVTRRVCRSAASGERTSGLRARGRLTAPAAATAVTPDPPGPKTM